MRLGRRRADVLFQHARAQIPALDLGAGRRTRQDNGKSLSRPSVSSKAGGDYYHTNYPQPTYISSRHYALHVETTAYSVFDFRRDTFHEIEAWLVPEHLEFFAADTFKNLVGQLSARFGRQPELPDWVYNGAIIGLRMASSLSSDWKESAQQASRCRAFGVKTGLACATPASAPDCFGTGKPMKSATGSSPEDR